MNLSRGIQTLQRFLGTKAEIAWSTTDSYCFRVSGQDSQTARCACSFFCSSSVNWPEVETPQSSRNSLWGSVSDNAPLLGRTKTLLVLGRLAIYHQRAPFGACPAPESSGVWYCLEIGRASWQFRQMCIPRQRRGAEFHADSPRALQIPSADFPSRTVHRSILQAYPVWHLHLRNWLATSSVATFFAMRLSNFIDGAEVRIDPSRWIATSRFNPRLLSLNDWAAVP